MFSRIHNQFGTAGLILSVVAIVLALGGGAYAANNSATASKAGKPGPRGKTGATGPAGPQGTAGPTGPTGPAGTNGTPGTEGKAGTNGKSVVTGNATNGECSSGGATVEVEGTPTTKKKVCNGQTGFTATLPPGKTETGDWSDYLPSPEGNESLFTTASYSIPLASEPEEANLHFIKPEEATPAGCEGNVANPGAEPGNLCIFAAQEHGPEGEGGGVYICGPINVTVNSLGCEPFHPGTTGFGLLFNRPVRESKLEVSGTFAVTEAG